MIIASDSDSPSTSGKNEGIAKCLSQVFVYGMDKRKTMLQVHGKRGHTYGHVKNKATLMNCLHGVTVSSLLSGLVYFTYFTVYNSLTTSKYMGFIASPMAAFVTSFIKLPVGNGMRLVQSEKARTIWHAGRKLHRSNGIRGLYTGYRVALIEDVVEMSVRDRIYETFMDDDKSVAFNIVVGMIASSFAAGFTTPCDILRLHMCMGGRNLLSTATDLISAQGPTTLYRGVAMRTVSNAVKSASFFTIFEMLKKSSS
jgi:hypothetical protein